MAFVIKGTVTGGDKVVQALNRAEPVFVRYLASWLQDERARFVGGKNSKGRSYPGYRTLLAGKRLKGRPGTWSKQVAHLFKGYMPMAHRIGDLRLTMGVGLQHAARIHKALWFLAEGGTVTSQKEMPVPVFRNLAEQMGITKGFSGAKAFKRLLGAGELFGVRKGNRTFYFNFSRRTESNRIRRTKPLFVGVHSLTVEPQLAGRYDFYKRWDDAQPKILQRGGGVVDRAVVAVDRGKLD